MDNVSELHRRIEFTSTVAPTPRRATTSRPRTCSGWAVSTPPTSSWASSAHGSDARPVDLAWLPHLQLFGVSSSVVRDDEPDARSGPSAAARPYQQCGAHRRGGAPSTLRGPRAPLRRVRPEAGFAWSDHHRRPRAGQEVHSGVGPPGWAIGRWSGPRDTARSELHAGSGPHHPQARSQHI